MTKSKRKEIAYLRNISANFHGSHICVFTALKSTFLKLDDDRISLTANFYLQSVCWWMESKLWSFILIFKSLLNNQWHFCETPKKLLLSKVQLCCCAKLHKDSRWKKCYLIDCKKWKTYPPPALINEMYVDLLTEPTALVSLWIRDVGWLLAFISSPDILRRIVTSSEANYD